MAVDTDAGAAALLEPVAGADALLFAPLDADGVRVPVPVALAGGTPVSLLEPEPVPVVQGGLVLLAMGVLVPLAVRALVPLAVAAGVGVRVTVDEGDAALVATTCTAAMHAYVLSLSHRSVALYQEPLRPSPCACLAVNTAAALPSGTMLYVRQR